MTKGDILLRVTNTNTIDEFIEKVFEMEQSNRNETPEESAISDLMQELLDTHGFGSSDICRYCTYPRIGVACMASLVSERPTDVCRICAKKMFDEEIPDWAVNKIQYILDNPIPDYKNKRDEWWLSKRKENKNEL